MGVFQWRVTLTQGECFYYVPSIQLTKLKLIICLSSKSGGRGGKHITALSYIGVQVFEQTHSRWFTDVPSRTAQGSLRCCPRYISSCASVLQCRRMRPGWLKSRKVISWSSKPCPEGWNALRKHLVSTKESRCIVPQCVRSSYMESPTAGHDTMARSQSGHGPSRNFWRPALDPDKFRSESGRTPPCSGSGPPEPHVTDG